MMAKSTMGGWKKERLPIGQAVNTHIEETAHHHPQYDKNGYQGTFHLGFYFGCFF